MQAPLTYEECEAKKRELLAKGKKSGLNKEEVGNLVILETAMDTLSPRLTIYDREHTCDGMLIACLQKHGEPVPLGVMCMEIEANNNFWQYRSLRNAGTLGVSKGKFKNVATDNDKDNFVLALPDWYRDPPDAKTSKTKKKK